MSADHVLAALHLPASARQHQRIAKKVLLQEAAATSSDRRLIEHGMDDIIWAAALKPGTIAVAGFRDDVLDWPEIAVVTVRARAEADTRRIATLLHRAIPYPLFLIVEAADATQISVARLRIALNDPARRVCDAPLMALLPDDSRLRSAALGDFALSALPALDMRVLYEALVVRIEALQAAHMTGVWSVRDDPAAVSARRTALEAHRQLSAQLASVRKQAAAARSMRDRVDFNLKVQAVEAELRSVLTRL